MIRPKSPPVHVLMKPRTHKLNAHRTLEYYTPEDVQKLVDQLGDRVVAVPVVNQADLASATCTCPSGDGSLRWPCPKHPPAQREQTPREWVEERFRKGQEAYWAERSAPPAALAVPAGEPTDEAIRTGWRCAVIMARNVCVKRSNDWNEDDGPSARIDEANECSKAIGEWSEPDEDYMAQMRAMLAQQPAAAVPVVGWRDSSGVLHNDKPAAEWNPRPLTYADVPAAAVPHSEHQ